MNHPTPSSSLFLVGVASVVLPFPSFFLWDSTCAPGDDVKGTCWCQVQNSINNQILFQSSFLSLFLSRFISLLFPIPFSIVFSVLSSVLSSVFFLLLVSFVRFHSHSQQQQTLLHCDGASQDNYNLDCGHWSTRASFQTGAQEGSKEDRQGGSLSIFGPENHILISSLSPPFSLSPPSHHPFLFLAWGCAAAPV